MNRFIIGGFWDRINRNGLNKNFEYLFEGRQKVDALNKRADSILNEANRINDINNDTNERLDRIIADSGTSSTEVIDARGDHTVLSGRLNASDVRIDDAERELKKRFMIPYYVEFYGSFNKFGIGVPEGYHKYTGGNYVLRVSGSAGDSFVTVQSGNISDAGVDARWACVIENNDGLFDINQVTGTSGTTRVNLLKPLKKSISNKRLGNIHESNVGQHYTELGYYAFAQHLYFTQTKHSEREGYIAKMNADSSSGSWESNAYNSYNNSGNAKNPNNYFQMIGTKRFLLSATAPTHYTEWEQSLDGQKGYLEIYIGMSRGSLKVEFFADGKVRDSMIIGPTTERLTFDYEGIGIAKIKITAQGEFSPSQAVYIGQTTWWVNEKFQDENIIDPDDKLIFIGDSWGEYHNKAVTRELERLMIKDGGNPTVLDFSKGGHTSTYARAWFDEYVIKNKPDRVVIEYFTNDFNSMNSVDVGTFTNPEGNQQNMNISNLDEYVENINYMIGKAIENGIQPIIVMPAAVGTESQSSTSADYAMKLWTGKSLINEVASFKEVETERLITNLLEGKESSNVGETLELISKQINSAIAEGIISNTSNIFTAGNIHTFKNNGETKASITHRGTLNARDIKMITRGFLSSPNETDRGTLYIVNGAVSGNNDELRIVMKNADGTYSNKKILLSD